MNEYSLDQVDGHLHVLLLTESETRGLICKTVVNDISKVPYIQIVKTRKNDRSSQFVQQWSCGRYFHTYFYFQTEEVDQAGAGRRQVLLHPGDVAYGHAGL